MTKLLALVVLVMSSLTAVPRAAVAEPLPGIGSSVDLAAGAWRFTRGDDLGFAAPTFDDSAWSPISVGSPWGSQGHGGYYGFGWYRTDVTVPAQVATGPRLVVRLEHPENELWLYVNGTLVGSTFRDAVQADVPRHLLHPTGPNVIAVRVLCDPSVGLVGYNGCGLTGAAELTASSTTRTELPVKVTTDKLGNVTEPDQPLALRVDVANTTTTSADLTVRAVATERETGTVALDESEARAVPSGTTSRFTLPFSASRRGPYDVHVSISDAAGKAVGRDVVIGVADPPGPEDDRFGVNVMAPANFAAANGDERLVTYDLAARAGARWMRDHLLPWSTVQPEPDTWQWGMYDWMQAESERTGVRTLWNILGVPYWAQGFPHPTLPSALYSGVQYPPDADHYDDYANFFAAAAARYPGQHWEIGNEWDAFPDHMTPGDPTGGGPEAYAEVMRLGFAGVTAADPTATVVLGGLQVPEENTFPQNAVGGRTWFQRFLGAGGKDAFHVMNFHAYSGNSGTPDPIVARGPKVQAVLDEFGIGDRPTWNTETNYNLPDTEHGRQAAARNLVESLAAGLEKVFFFTIVTDPHQSDSVPWGMFDTAGRAQPSFFAHLTTTRMLAGLTSISAVSVDGVPGYHFTDGTRSVTAVWDDAGSTITVPEGTSVFDDYGNAVPLMSGSLTLGPRATWLVDGGDEVVPVVPDSPLPALLPAVAFVIALGLLGRRRRTGSAQGQLTR